MHGQGSRNMHFLFCHVYNSSQGEGFNAFHCTASLCVHDFAQEGFKCRGFDVLDFPESMDILTYHGKANCITHE